MKKLRLYICIILCIALLPLSVFAQNTPIQISTEAQLKNIVNNLSGSYILINDIILSESWTNIGTSSKYFTGTFDGNGYTISNLNMDATKDFKGLFGYAVGATFKNLTLEGNVNIYASTGDIYSNVGAFCGGARDCTFLNCISNVNVKGNKNVGGICGRAYGCTFTNCENNGTIIADENAGGICGRAAGSTLSVVRNYGDVSANTYAGGICGIINHSSNFLNTTIFKSFNSGAINVASSRGGGLVGFAQASSGNVTINDCFNTGTVSSSAQNAYLGGILGDCAHSSTNQATLNRCYNVGKISQNSFSGGISGGTELRYTNCYYLNNSGLPICANGANAGLTTENMLLTATYQGFDFSSVWAIDSTQDFKYPYLIDNPITFDLSITLLEIASLPYNTTYYESNSNELDTSNLKLTAYYNDGSIEKNISSGFTISTPEFYLGLNPVTVTYKGATVIFPIYVYRNLFEKEALLFGQEYYTPVYSQKNLENISLFPSEKYFLQNNIVCDSSFKGICSQDIPFSGIFLGNNKTITLNIQSNENAALFVSIANSAVRDLTIDGSIKGSGVVGALCAYLTNSQISAITNKATVTALPCDKPASYVGAIAGYADFSSGSPYITKCKNLGEITLTSNSKTTSLGGLIGHVGISTNNTFSLSKSQNSASLSLISQNTSSNSYAGGLIGSINIVSGSGTIELNETYSLNQLSLTSFAYAYLGGLVGDFNIDSLTKGSLLIKNSFNLSSLKVIGTPNSITFGGIISTAAYDTVTLSDCYSSADFNINNTSKGGAITSAIDFNGTINNCYYLKNPITDTNATELSFAQALEQASYTGFDFESTWKLDNSFIYPQLLSIPLDVNATEIKILTSPTKLEYIQNTENFSADGGELLVKFDNGSEFPIPLSSAQIDGFDNSTIGKKTLTVTYLGKTTSLEVEITKKPAILDHIEITTPPAKLEYYIGEELNTDGLIVTAYYDNLTNNSITGYTVEGFDSSTVGTKVITVSFEGKTATFEVTVVERPVLLTEIKITTPPAKLEYYIGEGLNTDGLIVTAYYDNSTNNAITGYTISGFDSSTVGTKVITVSFEGKTTTFEVTVVERPVLLTEIKITTPPAKLEYYIGEEFDTDGLIVTAYYDNLTNNAITGYTISDFDSSTLGTKTITVSFEGKTATFEVTVVERPALVPDKITSSSLIISDTTVSKISAGTTVKVLLSNINEAQYCAVFNGEQQLNDNDTIATGMLIKLFDGTTVKATYTLNVTGDLDGNGLVTDSDAIYLLYSTFLPQTYPITQDCDFNKDGFITDQDAIYLLYSTFLPEQYPL